MKLRNALIFSAIVISFDACKHPSERPADQGSLLKLDKHVPNASGLEVRDGYLEFTRHRVLEKYKKHLPTIDSPTANDFLRSDNTMWYDNDSMLFSYQDSQETVVGIRHNTVGFDVGMRNKSIPGIHKLIKYFDPEGFKFPFKTTAGLDDSINTKVFKLWKPPFNSTGKVKPVVYWKEGSRKRWRWVFPVGTMFGEAMFIKNPEGGYSLFEFRTRTRYTEGWATDLFRPFTTSRSLANAIKAKRSDYSEKPDLKKLVEHLENQETLQFKELTSIPYGPIFKGLKGGFDVLPPINDPELITDLLRTTKFTSQSGVVWKSSGDLESFAPSTQSDYHVVPKNYTGGLIAVNEVSCTRCHQDTGRRLGELDSDVVLYGEMWGEDRIFSWHLFEPTKKFYATFDKTRKINPLLVKAGLVQNAKPRGTENTDYQILPVRFEEHYY